MAGIRKCPDCGNVNPATEYRCLACGYKLDFDPEDQAVYQPTAPVAAPPPQQAAQKPAAPAQASGGASPAAWLSGIGGVLFLMFMFNWIGNPGAPDEAAKFAIGGTVNRGFGPLTLSEYQRIHEGMSYREVCGIIGCEGEELSSSVFDYPGTPVIETVMYMWEGSGEFGANANFMFQNDRLINKAQIGLR